MTTWPEMQLPPINLYNAPVRGKDAIVTTFQEWMDAALRVANAEGMANEEVIPTWPRDCVERFPDLYPQLTVGALRQWQASCSEFPNGSTIGDAPSVAKILIDRVVSELEVGFVACNRCGVQEDTATLDCMDDLKILQGILSVPKAARSEAFILRTQAEALDGLEEKYRAYPNCRYTLFSVAENLQAVSKLLRQKADELEKAGGNKPWK